MKTTTFWLLLLLMVGLLFPRSLHSQGTSTLSFTRHDLILGGNPLGIASADFNGDGKQDLAVLYGPSGATRTFVAMFLGNGDGTFALLNTFDTGFVAPWLITADLNRDNKPDLVIANGFGRSISVLLGNGDGTFGTSNVIPLPGRIESVIAADFNGDGNLDIAAPDFEFAPQPSVSILLGNGDGTFGSNTEYPTLDTPFVVIADDFNKDGKIDLAINGQFGGVSVLLGNGDGTFQPNKNSSTGSAQSSGLASGDFNGDGKLDLAVANNADDSVSILFGAGDGTFALQPSIALPVTPFRVLARDVDADGKLDLVVARRNSAAVSILRGNSDGTFGTPIDFATGVGPQFLIATDLNRDGKLDLVTANYDAGSISILLNTTPAGPGMSYCSGTGCNPSNGAYLPPYTENFLPGGIYSTTTTDNVLFHINWTGFPTGVNHWRYVFRGSVVGSLQEISDGCNISNLTDYSGETADLPIGASHNLAI